MSLSSKVNYALDVSGITVGNINITGSIFQNNNPYVASQWTTTSGNLLTYTSGNVNISNGGLIAGTLNVSTITSGNILVRGSSIRFNTAGNDQVSVDISSNQVLRFGATEQYQTQMLVVGDNWSSSGGRLTARYSRYSSWEYVNGVSGLPDIKMIVVSSGNVGIGTTNPSTTLDVTGTGRITTSLTTGALFSTNQTTTNIVATSSTITNLNIPGTLTVVNVTSTNLVDSTISAGSLVGTTASIANIVGVNLTTGTLRSTGVVNLTSTITIPSTVNNYSTTSGAVNISGDIVIPGSNEIMFTNTRENPPTMNGRSSGTRLLLYPTTGTNQGDYAIGIEPFNMWFQVLNNNSGYKFYQGTSANLVLATGGNVGIGITSPTDKLEVNGNMRITNGNLTLGGLVNPTITILSNSTNAINGGELRMLESTQNFGWLQRHNSVSTVDGLQFIKLTNNTESTLLMLHGVNNRVGIATTNPANTLDVVGDARISTSLTTGALYSTNQTTTNIVATSSTITNLNIPGTLTVVNVTSTNLVDTNITAVSVLITSGGLSATFNSNTLGNIFTTGGNVGIGTSSPSMKLDVNGTIRSLNGTNAGIELFGVSSTLNEITSYNRGATSFMGLQFTTNYTTFFTNNTMTLFMSSGNVGIGTTSPATKLDVSGDMRITSGGLNATFNSNTIGSIITTGGNVGIGTTSPSEQLHLTGNILIRPNTMSSTNSNYIQFADPDGGTGPMQIRYHDTGTAALCVMGGRLGISTTTPSNTLDVLGTGRITTSLTTGALFSTNQTTTNIVATSSTITNLNIPGTLTVVNVTSTNLLVTSGGLSATFNSNTLGNLFTTGGNVGIGTTSPSEKLHVASGSILIENTAISGENPHTYINFAESSYGDRFGIGCDFSGAGNANNFYITSNSNGNIPLLSDAKITVRIDGSVGIGTTSPRADFEVNGYMAVHNGLRLIRSSNINYIQSGTNAGSTSEADLRFTNINAGTTYMTIKTSGNIGIGITSPVSTLDVNGNINVNNGLISSFNSNTIGNIVTTGGNVGIGTTSPAYTLDVTGSGDFSTFVTTGSLFSTNQTTTNIVATSSTITNLNIPGTLTVVNITSTNLLDTNITTVSLLVTSGGLSATFNSNTIGNIFTTGGNVGIGTTTPRYLLDINGNGRINGPLLLEGGTTNYMPGNTVESANLTGTYLVFGQAGSLNDWGYLRQIGGSNAFSLVLDIHDDGNDAGFQIRDINSATNPDTITTRFMVNRGGNVGINTTNPLYTLDVSGDIRITSGGLLATFNSNTLGSLFTTGGNVGINTSAPGTFRLNVNGTAIITTSLTTGAILSTNQTTTNIVSTNQTTTNIISTNQTVTNIVSTNITSGTIRATTLISTSNLSTSNFSAGTVLITNTTNANGIGTGGALTVAGGTSVARDLYVGGSIIGNCNVVSVQTTSFSVNSTDKNKLFVITGAATVSLLSATSAGSGFTVSFKKTVGITGQVQILPSTGNIDGFSNYVLSTENEIVTLVSDGSTWDITYSRNQVFASVYSLPGTYTFTVPNPITTVYACVFGAGGGGGNGAVGGSGNGGGGGGYVEGTIAVSPGDSLTITVGEGGTADTAGGNSSLGDLLATGGGAGGKNVSGSWGGNGSAGSGSGGTINRSGGTGGQSPSQTSGGGGGGGGAGFSASGNAASGYQGGNGSGIYGGIGATAVVSSGTSVRIFNFYREGGGGGSGNLTGATTTGANGGFPGGGGSGGAGGNSAGSGADGGVVIFY